MNIIFKQEKVKLAAQERKEVGKSLLDLKDFISHIPENTIAAMKAKVLKYADIEHCSIADEFLLPEVDYINANLESLRQGLKKCKFVLFFSSGQNKKFH